VIRYGALPLSLMVVVAAVALTLDFRDASGRRASSIYVLISAWLKNKWVYVNIAHDLSRSAVMASEVYRGGTGEARTGVLHFFEARCPRLQPLCHPADDPPPNQTPQTP